MPIRHDRRNGSPRLISHKLSEEERQRILLTCNQAEFASLPPGQIVPALADQGLYIGSQSSFYRLLHAHGHVHPRGRGRPPQELRPIPRSWPQEQIRCGVGTSPICPPPCARFGFTSNW
jgi:putative transposase